MSFPLPVTLLSPGPAASVAPEPAPRQAMNLIHAILEALVGRRSLHQLRPHLRWEAFENLAGYVDSGAFRRVRVGRVRSQMPSSVAVEAAVTLLLNGRVISCVLRLDATRTAWRCTEFAALAPMGITSEGASAYAA